MITITCSKNNISKCKMTQGKCMNNSFSYFTGAISHEFEYNGCVKINYKTLFQSAKNH